MIAKIRLLSLCSVLLVGFQGCNNQPQLEGVWYEIGENKEYYEIVFTQQEMLVSSCEFGHVLYARKYSVESNILNEYELDGELREVINRSSIHWLNSLTIELRDSINTHTLRRIENLKTKDVNFSNEEEFRVHICDRRNKYLSKHYEIGKDEEINRDLDTTKRTDRLILEDL